MDGSGWPPRRTWRDHALSAAIFFAETMALLFALGGICVAFLLAWGVS